MNRRAFESKLVGGSNALSTIFIGCVFQKLFYFEVGQLNYTLGHFTQSVKILKIDLTATFT